MKICTAALVTLALCASAADGQGPGAVPVSPSSVANDLIVHEWGTFLGVAGSDGVTLDGVYHEEHELPSFVYRRGREQLQLPSSSLKGETPVIYFYTEREQRVRVSVDFPQGVWTQWYPQASSLRPGLANGGAPPDLRGGAIAWCVDLLPASQAARVTLPFVDEDALWNHSRQVDAAFVKNRSRVARDDSEWERFLFYRGLGRAELPLTFQSDGARWLLRCKPRSTSGVGATFVVRVQNGSGSFRAIAGLEAGADLGGRLDELPPPQPLARFQQQLGDALEAALTAAGLYPKESQAMVSTWRQSYFATDGLRVLFLLPQSWTERFIPMQLRPAPRERVRVMVGRLELLTPDRERAAEEAVERLGSSQPRERELAFEFLRKQGRYVEPLLRRVLTSSEREPVRALTRRLLLSDFVRELQSASVVEADRVQRESTWEIRAQLAHLLAQSGLPAEARAEAERVLADLDTQTRPAQSQPELLHYLRAKARAHAALGDAPKARQSFGELVDYGSEVGKDPMCIACHRTRGPRDSDWFRDWWAGREYASWAARSESFDQVITRQETILQRQPSDRGTWLRLAFLYHANGDTERAEQMWTRLAGHRSSTSD